MGCLFAPLRLCVIFCFDNQLANRKQYESQHRMPHIVSIAFSPPAETPRPADHYHRVPVASATLAVDHGIESDRKSKGGDRQINIMSATTLARLRDEGFKTGPGEMGEQLVVEGIDIDTLPAGTRLRLGTTATVEVVLPRSGCDRFEKIQGQHKRLVRGRLGVMVRVVTDGPIAVNDPVEIERAP
jgi:MOSC domain-containing protein YiiM